MAKYDLRKFYFTERIVNVWKSWIENVVWAETIISFKNRLDMFWSNQEVYYDWKAELKLKLNI
jgi:hypothetical protein